MPLGIARGGPRPFSRRPPRAAAYAALRRDPAAPVDGFTSSWVARRHAPGPRVGAVGPSSASGRNSSGMWSRPSEFASSSSANMCSTLGRTPLSLQCLTVSGWVSRRRLGSAHGRPDSSLKRTSRSWKSSVLLLWCVHCRGIEPGPSRGQPAAPSKMRFPELTYYCPLCSFLCGPFCCPKSFWVPSSTLRVVRADGPAAGHSARVRLTSTVSTSARTAPWFVAHPYWVAPEENSRMLAPCELRVVAPTCNVKPTGRALSNVR